MATKVVRTQAFVISLDDAHQRRTRFADRARAVEAKVDWTFFDAHRGLDPRLAYEPALAQTHYGRALRQGELGCYSSHVGTWRALLEGDADQCIVLEDDVIVDWRTLELVAQNDFAGRGHHYVRLYCRRPSQFVVLDPKYLNNSTSLLRLLGKPYGTQGYVMTRTGAERMLEVCSTVVRPIDDQMDRFWEHGVPNLAIFPPPILEEAVPSMIGQMRLETGEKIVQAGRPAGAWKDALHRSSLAMGITLQHKLKRRLQKLRR